MTDVRDLMDNVINEFLERADGYLACEKPGDLLHDVLAEMLTSAGLEISQGWSDIKHAPWKTGFEAWLWNDEWKSPKIGALLFDAHWYEKHTNKLIHPTKFYVLPSPPVSAMKETE